MVVLNTVFLSLLVPSAIMARGISHEQLHKRHVQPKPVVGTSVAPYPTSKNATLPNPVASQAAITIVSTIDVVPVPVSQANSSPSKASSPEGSGATGDTGKGGAKAGSGGNGGSSPAGSPQQCGPPTVTVTATAKTVTVTAGAGASSSAPASSSTPAVSPAPAKPAEKAYSPTAPEKAPEKPASPPASSPASPPASTPAQPDIKSDTPKVAEKKVEQPAQPEAPKSTPPAVAPQTAPASQASQAPQTSSPPKKSSGGKKGILYADLSNANAMDVSWGCNWDSSPIPAIGHASGQLSGGKMFVPQLWGPEDVHTSIWAANSKGAEYVMAFNEPNQPQSAGGCGPMSPGDAVAPYEKNLKPNKDAGQKIISPCVSNDAHQWLDTFLGSTSLKPDAVCFHWYGLSLTELQGVVKTFAAIQSKYNIPELWLTEWALNVDISTSDAKNLLSWLDTQSGVDRYAYNNNNLVKTPGVKAAYNS